MGDADTRTPLSPATHQLLPGAEEGEVRQQAQHASDQRFLQHRHGPPHPLQRKRFRQTRGKQPGLRLLSAPQRNPASVPGANQEVLYPRPEHGVMLCYVLFGGTKSPGPSLTTMCSNARGGRGREHQDHLVRPMLQVNPQCTRLPG